MKWQDSVFKKFTLYAVTDLCGEARSDIEKIEAVYQGGADIIQLRSKTMTDASLIRLGAKIRKVATKHRKLFFINDRIDLAALVKADGVHLGQDDMPLADAKKIARAAGMKFRFGKSTHSLSQALHAEQEGVDYIGVGPVFATPTKPDRKAVGLKLVEQVSLRVRVPCVAIGGINLKNISDVMKAGALRVAVVRAIFDSKRPRLAAEEFKTILER